MKTCSKCKQTKEPTEFNKNRSAPDGLQTFCRVCHNAYSKSNYPRFSQRIYDANIRRRVRNRLYMSLWLATHPCVDCGEDDIRVLEFDHINPKRGRRYALSLMTYRQASLETIRAEIDLCQIRCANCHRVKTARERNWYARTLPQGFEAEIQNLQSAGGSVPSLVERRSGVTRLRNDG